MTYIMLHVSKRKLCLMVKTSPHSIEKMEEPGQITDVPKAGFAIKNSSYFVEDGSYLRLKNLTFLIILLGNC